jgi:hypothetical protein
MRVAQFEDAKGLCIGIEADGRWVNYSTALSVHSLVTKNTLLEPPATIHELLIEDSIRQKCELFLPSCARHISPGNS